MSPSEAERDRLIEHATVMVRDFERELLGCADCVVIPYGPERPADYRLMTEHAGFVRPCKRHR